MSRRANALVYVSTAVLCGAYYALLAQPLVMAVVGWLTSVLSLSVGPALAALWFVAEALFILVPYAVLAIVSVRSRAVPQRIWLAPLVVFWLPVMAVALFGIVTVGDVTVFSGLGGALAPPMAIIADLLGTAIGCALVVWGMHRQRVRRRSPRSERVSPTEGDGHDRNR